MPDKTPQTEMEEHDKAKRIQTENEILAMAQSLTNGHAGDKELEGKVRLWQVEETIENGRMLRTIVASLKKFKLESECVLAHSGKVGTVVLFGQTYKIPLSIIIGGYFAYKIAAMYEPIVSALTPIK